MNRELCEKLTKRIPYDKDIFGSIETYKLVLQNLIDDSINICLSIRYPFLEDFSDITLPNKYDNWILRACVELYNMADKSGIANYTENGISWSKLTDGLSLSLTNEITSKVGTPKRREDEDV